MGAVLPVEASVDVGMNELDKGFAAAVGRREIVKLIISLY